MTNPLPSAPLPEIWARRFAFYDAHGMPNATPAARQAFKALPFGTRMRLNSNILAFLFGPIYFFVKGMWRKALTLLGAGLVIGIIFAGVDGADALVRAVNLLVPLAAMLTANYAYYLHVRAGSVSWNPFEGMGKHGRDGRRAAGWSDPLT